MNHPSLRAAVLPLLLGVSCPASLHGAILLQPGNSGTFLADGQGAHLLGFEQGAVNHDLFLCLSSNESKAPGGGNLSNPNGFAAGYNFGNGATVDLTETVQDPDTGNTYLIEPFIDVAETLGLNQVPLVGDHRVFVFDANQQMSDPLIFITTLEIYTSGSATVGSAAEARSGNLVYDLDGGGTDRSIEITGSTGTSRWNLALYVPDAWFVTEPGGEAATYVQFYSEHLNDNDGFDHWGVDMGLVFPVVPEPAAILLVSLGMVGVLRRRR